VTAADQPNLKTVREYLYLSKRVSHVLVVIQPTLSSVTTTTITTLSHAISVRVVAATGHREVLSVIFQSAEVLAKMPSAPELSTLRRRPLLLLPLL
jgi:hypothetical protein